MYTTKEEDAFPGNSRAHSITSKDAKYFHGSGPHSVMMEYGYGWNLGAYT
jgi:hypothetical protein